MFSVPTLYHCPQVEVNVSRDPSRLYKLTAGWEQRRKEGPGTSGQGPGLHMPHRYVNIFFSIFGKGEVNLSSKGILMIVVSEFYVGTHESSW